MTETITQTPLAGTETNVDASAGTGAGSNDVVMEVKDLLKDLTGKEFPTNEAAIKSLSDTYKWGNDLSQKVKTLETQLADAQAQPAAPEVMKEIELLKAQMASQGFYTENPQYNTTEAKALIGKFGGKPEDVVKDDVFQTAYKAIQTTTELDKSKSVLHTNPRLGNAQDNMTKASEASKAGDAAGAAAAATMGVIEAYGMS